MIHERDLWAQRSGKLWGRAGRCQSASTLLVVQCVHVGLDHQALALDGLGFGRGLLRIKLALVHVLASFAQRVERLGSPSDRDGLGAPREIDDLALLFLGLADLFAELGDGVVVEDHRDRLATALGRVAKAEIDVLRKPAGIVALAGDEGRVIGLLDTEALDPLGIPGEVKNL